MWTTKMFCCIKPAPVTLQKHHSMSIDWITLSKGLKIPEHHMRFQKIVNIFLRDFVWIGISSKHICFQHYSLKQHPSNETTINLLHFFNHINYLLYRNRECLIQQTIIEQYIKWTHSFGETITRNIGYCGFWHRISHFLFKSTQLNGPL